MSARPIHRVTRRSTAYFLAVLVALASALPVQALTSWTSKVDASVLKTVESGNAEFIVYMNTKADLSGAKLLGSKVAKGTFVYEALTETAQASQAGVLAVLRGAGAPAQSFWISNSIVTKGGLDVLRAVAERADVKSVFAVGKGELHEPVDRGSANSVSGTDAAEATAAVGPSIDYVQADDTWALGYRGQGVVVAGADTGVRWTHNAIKRQYRGFNATTGTADHNYNWHSGSGPNETCSDGTVPCDDDDHGTHTVGTIVGDDGGANQIGMAPDAEWIGCKNMNHGVGVVPTYMDCMQWFIAPTDSSGSNPDPSKAPDVVNNSWGCIEACAPPMLKDMIDASRAAGIFYAVSAGNDNQGFIGPEPVNSTMLCNTINFPLAVYDSAFTVGATDAAANGVPSDRIAGYSSLGPVTTNPSEGILYRKPDIVAPGTFVRSAISSSDGDYAAFSGTSMAGPHVAGLVALILSANPSLRGDVATIERVIRQSAKPLTSNRGCGGDTNTEVPNNEFGWGRINALAAVQLALETQPTVPVEEPEGEPLDPAHNVPLPCEAISTSGTLPRSAKNIAHVANVCGIVGTDIEFQSRTDDNGVVHDYAFVGTMGAGAQIFDITDPQRPVGVGGYIDPGWQNDVSLFGDTMITAFDPLGGPIHLSDCLKAKNPTALQGGVDVIDLDFNPLAAVDKLPTTFTTNRVGCYLNRGGGAHTITVHPSGEWLSVNTSSGNAIEVVDLRNNALTLVRQIPSSLVHSAHDVFFSRDGNTLYSAGLGSTRIVDVTNVLDPNEPLELIANIPNNPSAAQGADGHVIQISHQSDTTSDGRLLIVTDEKGGGLSQTSCNTTNTGNNIGGASLWALQEIPGVAKSTGASVTSPLKVGTWIYPNPGLAVDQLDPVLASLGRTERACTIHVFRAGGNGGHSPAAAGVGDDGNDGVSRLPVNEIVSAHYGAGVWHIDVMSAPGALDDSRTTWGRTLGWNVMPGAETWSAKEYKGHIYTGDMTRGFDVYRFMPCDGVACVVLPTDPQPTPQPTPTPTATATATPTATPTASPTPTATPTPTLTPTPDDCVTTNWVDTLEPSHHAGWTWSTARNEAGATSPTWAHQMDTGAKSASHSWSTDAKTLLPKDDLLYAPTQAVGRTTQLSFWHRYFTEGGFDGGVLEVSLDAGATWEDVTAKGTFVAGGYTGEIDAGFNSPIAGRAAWTGGSETARTDAMTQVVVSLGGFVPAGSPSVNAMLRWRFAADDPGVGALPGDAWWIDDIQFANVIVSCTQATPTPTPTPAPADLVVSAMSASEQKPKEGAPVRIDVTVANTGSGAAGASKLELRLDDGTLLGNLDVPALAAGATANLSQGWDTRGVSGQRVITATADAAGAVAEASESNNVGRLTVEIRGNKVKNGSFEQANSSGNAPESWQGQSTGSGTTSYNQGSGSASDGSDSVSITGTGGNALLTGVATWTSAPIAVSPGELLELEVDVRSVGLSSAPQVSVAYVGAAGQVLNTVKVLSAPLTTSGAFKTLSQTLVVPANATSLRIVLAGFAPTDTRTKGTVSFDNVGLFGP